MLPSCLCGVSDCSALLLGCGFVRDVEYLVDLFGFDISVASQATHPGHVLVLVVSAHHVHDLAGILLIDFAFEALFEVLVPATDRFLELLELVSGTERSRGWVKPGVRRVVACGILVATEVHVERDVFLRAVLDFHQVGECC